MRDLMLALYLPSYYDDVRILFEHVQTCMVDISKNNLGNFHGYKFNRTAIRNSIKIQVETTKRDKKKTQFTNTEHCKHKHQPTQSVSSWTRLAVAQGPTSIGVHANLCMLCISCV